MSTICEFCKQVFSCKNNLSKHQITAKYCLELQGKHDEIKRRLKINSCSYCNESFSTKGNLKRHKTRCFKKENPTVYNNINNGTVNNTNMLNQVNIFLPQSFTINELTSEYCEKVLKPLIDAASVKSMGALMDKAVPGLLQKDGKWIAYCSDRSRNSFQLLEMNENGQAIVKKDPNGLKLTRIIQDPLARSVAANMKHASEDVIKEIRDLPSSSAAKDAIKDRLPSSMESEDWLPGTRALIESYDKHEGVKLLEEELKKRAAAKQIQEEKSALDNFDNFIGQCQKVGSYYVHETLKYVVELIDSNTVITGKQLSDGKIVTLTKADLNDLTRRGYSKYLDNKYKSI
jgi:hypothetical protein